MGRKKVLLVTQSPPYPTNVGGNQRTNLLFRALIERFDVDLLILKDPSSQDNEALARLKTEFNLLGMVPETVYGRRGYFKYIHFLFPNLVNRLAHHFLLSKVSLAVDDELVDRINQIVDLENYDIVVSRQMKPACITGYIDRKITLIDIDDMESDVWESRLRSPDTKGFLKRNILKLHAKSFDKGYLITSAKASGVWVTKSSDLTRLKARKSRLLVNIPYSSSLGATSEPRPLQGKSHKILGVAALFHHPNFHGYNWFITQVWPIIKSKVLDAEFLMVGPGLTDEISNLWRDIPGVNLLGTVDDLDKYYQESQFTVAPIFSGGGTNIKVIESLFYGKSCVCTDHAARGYEPNDAILMCGSIDSFASKCIELLQNEDMTYALGNLGHEYAMKNFSYDSFSKIVNELVDEVALEC